METNFSNLQHRKKWQRYKDFAFSGDWHIHTNYTDGKCSIEECFIVAQQNNLNFLAFTEHVREKMEYDYFSFKKEVYDIGRNYCIPFTVGAEAKVVNTDGEICITDEIAKETNLILFAFHSPYFKTKKDYITAIINTCCNPIVDVWAHPTIYANRMNFSLSNDDLIKIGEALEKNKVCLELNVKHDVPDLKFLKRILGYSNIDIVVGSDAHVKSDFLSLDRLCQLKEKALNLGGRNECPYIYC